MPPEIHPHSVRPKQFALSTVMMMRSLVFMYMTVQAVYLTVETMTQVRLKISTREMRWNLKIQTSIFSCLNANSIWFLFQTTLPCSQFTCTLIYLQLHNSLFEDQSQRKVTLDSWNHLKLLQE